MALLLLWQLNAAVAVPPASADATAHAGLAHCAHHVAGSDPAALTHRPDAPVAPDCCGHCATCQCIELTGLATAVFAEAQVTVFVMFCVELSE